MVYVRIGQVLWFFMALIQSILVGSEGNYSIFNTPVIFRPNADKNAFSEKFLNSRIAKIVNSKIGQISLFAYLHVFIHEMGHALARKMMKSDARVTVFTNEVGGFTSFILPPSGGNVKAKNSFVSLAGALSSMIFSCNQLAIGILIGKHVFKPLGYALGINATIWIIGELIQTFSGIGIEGADFSSIKKNGVDHLLICLSAVVSTCALGIFASIKLLYY